MANPFLRDEPHPAQWPTEARVLVWLLLILLLVGIGWGGKSAHWRYIQRPTELEQSRFYDDYLHEVRRSGENGHDNTQYEKDMEAAARRKWGKSLSDLSKLPSPGSDYFK